MQHLSMQEMYRLHLRGVKLEARSIAELELGMLDIKQPSELIANSPVLQKAIEKHWHTLISPILKKK
jgi:hypothetical protein